MSIFEPFPIYKNPQAKKLVVVGLVISLVCMFLLVASFFTIYFTKGASGLHKVFGDPAQWDGPTEVVSGQLNLIKEDKIQDAYNDFSVRGKTILSLDQFESLISKYPAISNNKSKSYSYTAINGKATINGILTADNNSQTIVEYHLIEENGYWKIDSIAIK